MSDTGETVCVPETKPHHSNHHRDSVVIPKSFYEVICKACDLLENMPMNKLMYCFGDDLSVTTLLLHERNSSSVTINNHHSPKGILGGRSDAISLPALPGEHHKIKKTNVTPRVTEQILPDDDSCLDIETGSTKLHSDVEIPAKCSVGKKPNITPRKTCDHIPKKPVATADSGEGNVFLPLKAIQSK
ncbi:unnamed protein product [Trichobilharzia regenti]|nr:unnamed protein product [Trichobilharzia regenti]